jgi:hypothetical protein
VQLIWSLSTDAPEHGHTAMSSKSTSEVIFSVWRDVADLDASPEVTMLSWLPKVGWTGRPECEIRCERYDADKAVNKDMDRDCREPGIGEDGREKTGKV